MPADSYFEDLLSVLLDPDYELTASRLAELSDLSRDRSTLLRDAWDGAPAGRRVEIVAKLGQMAHENIEFLFETVNRIALDDSEAEVRRTAIQNLWESESEEVGIQLIHLAQHDADEDVRLEAIRSLGRFAYLAELGDLSEPIMEGIERVLLPLLTDEAGDVVLRRLSLEALSNTSHPDVASQIQRHFESDSDEDIRSSLVAMGRSADRRWSLQVIENLENPNPRLRRPAARAAGELGLSESASLLVEMLDDPDQGVRSEAIWSLGQIGGDEARQALLRLQDEAMDSGHEQEIDEALDYIAFLDGTPDLGMLEFEDRDPPG